MTAPDSKYVSSSRPVNRRTAVRQPLPVKPLGASVRDKLATLKARGRLGPALAAQVRSGLVPAQQARLGAADILGGTVMAVSVVSLFLAWLQSSVLLALGGAGGIALALVCVWTGMRRRSASSPSQPRAPLFDEAGLQALDAAMDRVATSVPEAVSAQLMTLKRLIVRLAHQFDAAAIDENFTLEDRMYVTECIRRYLPDTLSSYLAVPAAQRDKALVDGLSAAQLLGSQLDLLRAELETRELRLGRSAAEMLLQQQRFLQAKANR